MRIRRLLASLCISGLLFSACQEKKSETLVLDNIVVFAEGPLFEGSNTAQGEISKPLASFMAEKGLSPDRITEAILSKASIEAADSSKLGFLQSLTLEMASDQTEMMRLGFVNPVPADAQRIHFSVAGEQKNLLDVLRQDKIYVVADANLPKDSAVNLDLRCRLEFEIKSK